MDIDNFSLRFDEWRDKVQRHVDRHNREAEILKSIIVVGAFIAGVQAQLISSTLTLPPTLQANVCNTLSFVGLIADITGTIFGAINAVSLQTRGRQGTSSLDLMAQLKGDLILVLKHQELKKGRDRRYTSVPHGESAAQAAQSLFQMAHTDGNTITSNSPEFNIITHNIMHVAPDLDDMAERSQNIIQILRKLTSRPSGTAIPEGLLGIMVGVAESAGPHKIKIPSDLPRSNELSSVQADLSHISRVPVGTTGLGVLCLAVAVIIFAAAPKLAPQENQGVHVWILCVCVLVGFGSASLPWSEWLQHTRVGTENVENP